MLANDDITWVAIMSKQRKKQKQTVAYHLPSY